MTAHRPHRPRARTRVRHRWRRPRRGPTPRLPQRPGPALPDDQLHELVEHVVQPGVRLAQVHAGGQRGLRDGPETWRERRFAPSRLRQLHHRDGAAHGGAAAHARMHRVPRTTRTAARTSAASAHPVVAATISSSSTAVW